MEDRPYFSIIIPTYNRAGVITRTIESVLSQTDPDFEIIVVDDGSTDNTEEVVNRIKDNRIKYLGQENGERGAARNLGIINSKGTYVTFLDSDDRLLNDNLTKAKQFIDVHGNPEWLHFSYTVVDEDGNEISRVKHGSVPEKSLLAGNYLSCLGVFVRNDIIKSNLFEEDRSLAGSEDWVLWMRLVSRYPLLVSDEVTAELVQHNERSVMNIIPEKLEKRIELAGTIVTSDEAFQHKFSQNSRVWAHLNLYTALHLALANHKKQSVQFLLRSLKEPSVLLTNKPYAVLGKLIL